MDLQIKEKVYQKYLRLFNSDPEVMVFAPGRVNLIGEHTDYSDGFVFPLAINQGIYVAFSPSDDDHLQLYSLDFEEFFEKKISNFNKEESNWREYIKGIAWTLRKSGYDLKGFKGVFAGNLPIGAGLSSSAALEVAVAKSFCISSEINLSNTELAKISQKAEQDWVGVNVGIMDQLISAKGKSGYALKLDCRTLEIDYFRVPESICIVVMDTNTRRELSHSEYNTRQSEVQTAVRILGVPHLRDASRSLLSEKKGLLPQKIYNRAKHVITENERVHAFGLAMKAAKLEEMGELLNESHISLRDNYEVSSKELNIIVDLAQAHKGCYGARLTGAGFGGCALALIDEDILNVFINDVQRLYTAKTGINPNIFKVVSADGVHVIDIDRKS